MSEAQVAPHTTQEEPPGTARLRARGCWTEAALLLAPYAQSAFGPALARAALLAEQCLFTLTGWQEAEDALRIAEALARTDDERGEAACERGHLACLATQFAVRDRADEASAALSRSAALLTPGRRGGRCWTTGGAWWRRNWPTTRRPRGPRTAGRTRGRWHGATPC